MRQQRDGVEHAAERAGIGRVHDDDELATHIAAKYLAAGHPCDGGFDLAEALGARLHEDGGDLAARRRDDALWVENMARDQGASVDGTMVGQG
jgi:hypothetical protein